MSAHGGHAGDGDAAATPSASGTQSPGFAADQDEGDGEVDLAARVLELERRNAELVELQRARDEMSSRFIHDMRSPMMVISANLEFAISTPGISAAERDEALGDSRQAATMLSRLMESLLHVTRLHSGRYVPRRTLATAAALVDPVRARMRVTAAPLQVSVDGEGASAPQVTLSVDVPLITHALDALADHVLERTPPGGTIRIECTAEGTGVCIRIGSTAPSMTIAERDVLFDRLGGASIPGAKTKFGAGLHLCRLVAEAHGGRFQLEESAALPTSFALSLAGQ